MSKLRQRNTFRSHINKRDQQPYTNEDRGKGEKEGEQILAMRSGCAEKIYCR